MDTITVASFEDIVKAMSVYFKTYEVQTANDNVKHGDAKLIFYVRDAKDPLLSKNFVYPDSRNEDLVVCEIYLHNGYFSYADLVSKLKVLDLEHMYENIEYSLLENRKIPRLSISEGVIQRFTSYDVFAEELQERIFYHH